MNKPLRFLAVLICFSALVLMGRLGAVWAGPGEQGTVPSGSTPGPSVSGPGSTLPGGTCATYDEATQPAPLESVTLNVCTGLATVPFGAFPRGGKATLEEITLPKLAALGTPPRGLNFLSNGVTLAILDRLGTPTRFFARPVLVCFPLPPGTLGVIRRLDTSFTPDRWVAFPTFRPVQPTGLICTRTRLPGTYAPIGR